MSDGAPLLEVEALRTVLGGGRALLGRPRPRVAAVDGVSLSLVRGEALGLVGESGCGKTTLAKTVLGLLRETSGTVRLEGRNVSGLKPTEARRVRRDIQYVHQDPGAALDPWWSVGHALDEALRIHGRRDKAERTRVIDRMLDAVGLEASFKRRYPHELSGGQQRRVGLARILVLEPRIVILDEPTAGLDLSVQATVLALFDQLRRELGLTYLLVSHDLAVVRRMCERIAVMYLGRIVESGPREAIYGRPRHPYTQALLSAAPSLVPGQLAQSEPLPGDPPSAARVPPGCAFHPRCRHAVEACGRQRPETTEVAAGHAIACHRWQEIDS